MASTFTYSPSYGAQANRKPSTKSVKFGDGYEQRQSNGLNVLNDVWDLTFANRTPTEAAAIDTFLTTQGGVNYFLWTAPNGVTSKYICREWNYQYVLAGAQTVTAKFEQVRDL